MAHPTSEGYILHTANIVIETAFDSIQELRHTLDHIALAESLFGSLELLPLSTPGTTPRSSPVLRARMDIDDNGDGDFSKLTPLNLEAPAQASSSIHPAHVRREYPLGPETTTQAPSSTQPMHANGAERRKAKKKAQSHANRQKARQTARESTYANIKVRPECTTKLINSSTPIFTNSDMKNASRINTGYTGRDGSDHSSKLYTLDELIGEGSKFGFKLQKWDGK